MAFDVFNSPKWLALSPTEKLERLAELDRGRKHKTKKLTLTEAQTWPDWGWRTWLFKGGRGAGKTFGGGYWCVDHCRKYGPKAEVVVAGRTLKDARERQMEGPSGIWRNYRDEFESYNRSTFEARHRGGGRIIIMGAEDPDQFIGLNSTLLWCDELCSWPEMSFINANLGCRLVVPGDHPRVIATTTPRDIKWLRRLAEDPSTAVTTAKTSEAHFLDQKARDAYQALYGGTLIGRQELDGEFVSNDGALWRQEWIESNRVFIKPEIRRRILVIDPAKNASERSDYTALVVICELFDGRVLVEHTEQLKVLPDEWGPRACQIYLDFGCGKLLYEENAGGKMVETIIRSVNSGIPMQGVTASKTKWDRSQPVSLFTQRGQVLFFGKHDELEVQLTSRDLSKTSEKDGINDDLLDAFVHGVRYFIDPDADGCFALSLENIEDYESILNERYGNVAV